MTLTDNEKWWNWYLSQRVTADQSAIANAEARSRIEWMKSAKQIGQHIQDHASNTEAMR